MLTRIDGVGSITVFGSRDYSMRVWLDPDRLQSLGLTAGDVVAALQGQNVQVAARRAQPAAGRPARRVPVRGADAGPARRSRTSSPTSWSSRRATAVVRLKDVARVELAALDYTTNSYLDRDPAVALGIFQRPGSNALATAKNDPAPRWMSCRSASRPASSTPSSTIRPSSSSSRSTPSIETIGEAVILVVLVVILFLQTWRAAVIPIVAIPVSLIGTFFFMAMFGFSLNNLSLFGLVLAIGIVVDDAIVVVENVERNIAAGLSPRDAAHKSMDEVGAALIAIALVLCAVFVPSAFITGISGQFYRQFALTIAGATIISLIVSLTLSPAMCALAAQAARPATARSAGGSGRSAGSSGCFNRGFERLAGGYRLARRRVSCGSPSSCSSLYVGVLAYGLNEFRKTPPDSFRSSIAAI